MTTFIPKHKCTCGYEMDATSQYGGDAKPSAGDASICFKCSRLWVFNADLTLRKPTPSELESFANDPEIAKALEALERTRDTRYVAVIAGNRQQFDEYLNTQDPVTMKGTVFIEASRPGKVVGIRFSEVVEVGTYYERKDYYDMKRELEHRMI